LSTSAEVRATVLRRIANSKLANTLHINVQVKFILCKVKREGFLIRFEVRLKSDYQQDPRRCQDATPLAIVISSKMIVVINIDQRYHMSADIIQEDDQYTFNSRYLLHKDLLRVGMGQL
jgi:predicted nucleic acid-binding protein